MKVNFMTTLNSLNARPSSSTMMPGPQGQELAVSIPLFMDENGNVVFDGDLTNLQTSDPDVSAEDVTRAVQTMLQLFRIKADKAAAENGLDEDETGHPDFGLEEDSLERKYDHEHPEFPRSDWKYEVSTDDTQLGYWTWVLHRVEEDHFDCIDCARTKDPSDRS